ncbi:class II aldolase/adducin family protein [Rhodopila sp.]|uniref:class II aldolase/adducin family protein n=1 Tax=Rhodopila sp. TaxID=2480087 RepID=UPI002C440454|nr:class II aldolase/adducin family protein [Rhodopila sp.]HVZ10271.1 class II aldolase/adducin family protein [Rhodopila sp.]
MIGDDIVWLYKAAAEKLIVGTSGNVSARTPEGMLMTPTGSAPAGLSVADLASATMQGQALNQNPRSSEWATHAAVYATCPGLNFLVHAHADAATALACLNERLPPFHYMVLRFGGDDVRCARYATLGTQALADLAAVAIHGRSACLLSNHGMIVGGATARQALDDAVLLETLCRQYLMARAAGTPRLLSKEEMQAARERFRAYGQA